MARFTLRLVDAELVAFRIVQPDPVLAVLFDRAAFVGCPEGLEPDDGGIHLVAFDRRAGPRVRPMR